MEILITTLVAGNFVGALCASIIAYYQTERELYETDDYEKISIEASSVKSSIYIDEEPSAVDIAKYIIEYLHRRGYHVNIITLGSLLYFVQARYAIEGRGKRCFKERIIAGCLSAEVQEVRSYFCGWGIMAIYPLWADTIPTSAIGEKIIIPVQPDERFQLVDLVLEECIEHDLTYLSEYIRNQRPWKEARKTSDCVITVESLRDYFLE